MKAKIGILTLSDRASEGKYDDLPENAFYMVGNIDEVVAKAEKMKA